jgi:hypothetical protein
VVDATHVNLTFRRVRWTVRSVTLELKRGARRVGVTHLGTLYKVQVKISRVAAVILAIRVVAAASGAARCLVEHKVESDAVDGDHIGIGDRFKARVVGAVDWCTIVTPRQSKNTDRR